MTSPASPTLSFEFHETLGLCDLIGVFTVLGEKDSFHPCYSREPRKEENSIPSLGTRAELVSLPWPKYHGLTSLLILIFLFICLYYKSEGVHLKIQSLARWLSGGEHWLIFHRTQDPHSGSQPFLIPVPGGSDALFWLPQTLRHTHGVQTYVQAKHPHTLKKK